MNKPNKSRQKTFDKVVKHLLKQGKQSLMSGGFICANRGANNTSCAVGCLLPDEAYLAAGGPEGGITDYRVQDILVQEGYAWLGTPAAATRAAAGRTAGAHAVMQGPTEAAATLYYLQIIHDFVSPSDWRRTLQAYAKVNGLRWPRCRPSDGYVL